MKTAFKTALLAATLSAIPSLAQAKSVNCAPVTTAAVEGQFKLFNDSWASHDPAKVTALFSKDAVLLATVSNKPRLTSAEINDYFVKFLKGSPVGTINTSTVSLGCNIATRLGTWTVTLTDAATGAKTDVKARYSFIYKYVAGRWKIYHLHSSKMPEPTS